MMQKTAKLVLKIDDTVIQSVKARVEDFRMKYERDLADLKDEIKRDLRKGITSAVG